MSSYDLVVYRETGEEVTRFEITDYSDFDYDNLLIAIHDSTLFPVKRLFHPKYHRFEVQVAGFPYYSNRG